MDNEKDPLGILKAKAPVTQDSPDNKDPLGILKKKESTELNQKPSGIGSQEPAQQPEQPLSKSSTEADQKIRAKAIQADVFSRPAPKQKTIADVKIEREKSPDMARGERAVAAKQEQAVKDFATGQDSQQTDDPIAAFSNTIFSGISDQLPKEYAAQRLRMSKGSFGDIFNPRSNISQFSEKLPEGVSRRDFNLWNNKQSSDIRSKSYDEKAELFLTEKFGKDGFDKLKSQFGKENLQTRKEFEAEIQQQNQEAAFKTKGVVQDLKEVKGASDFLNFAGNMIGQALYRAPMSLATGTAGNIIAESAAIYDRQLDLIAQDKGLTREQVIEQGLDEPAAGQSLAVLGGVLDAASNLNLLGFFKAAAKGALTKEGVKEFTKNFIKKGVPEGATEAIQSELEEKGASMGANTEYEYDPWRSLTSGIGGLLGGGVVGSITNVVDVNKTPSEVIKEATQQVDKNDVASLDQQAERIQAKVDTQEPKINERQEETIVQPSGEGVEQPGQGAINTEQKISENEKSIGSISNQEQITDTRLVEKLPTDSEQESDALIEQVDVVQPAAGEQVTPTADQPAQSDTVVTEGQAVEETIQTDTPPVRPTAPEAAYPVLEEPTTQKTESIALDVSEKEKLSGIKKALVPEEKAKSVDIERRSVEQMLTSAKEKVDSGEINPKSIVDEIANGNARALQADEVSSLVYYKTQLDNKSSKINANLLSAIESNNQESILLLKSQAEAIDKEIDNYNTMAVKTAYEQSLAFSMRKMLLDNEYNLQSQINKYKIANNGVISPEIEKKFIELDKQLKEANSKISALEEKQSFSKSSDLLKFVRQDLQNQREKRKKYAQERKQKVDDFFDSLKVKIDPNQLNSVTNVIGANLYNLSLEAIKKAVNAGATVSEAIQEALSVIRDNYKGSDFNEEEYISIHTPIVEKIVLKDTDEPSIKLKDGEINIPTSILKSLIESGSSDINTLVDTIYDSIKSSYPDITKRQIRDSITKYGETRTLSKDEIDVKLRKIKRMGRLISSIEDVQNKKRPLRSGLQRDKLSDEERRLQREIKEGLKNIPLDQTEADKAWKTALDGVKSRLKNQIVDLEDQIKTGEKSPKKKGIEYDQEAKDLQQKRDKLKEIIESIEGKPKMSDEQKIRMAVSSLEKQIGELDRKIKEKDVSKKEKSTTPVTEEIAYLKKQRDLLKKSYSQIEQDLGVTDAKRLDLLKKNLKKSAEKLEERIRTKDFESPKKKGIEYDQEATKLKLERDKIKQQFDIEREKVRLKNRPWNEKAWDTTKDIWNLPKSLLASIDMSAPFRQGAILTVSNPKAGVRAFSEMFKQAFSENKANEWLLKIKDSPEYALMKQSKLYLAEPNTKLTAKEEQFMSNLAGKIPVLGKLVGGSERAYTGYLNKLRSDVFIYGADQLKEQGVTLENNPEAYKQWANFINNATGRGNLGVLENSAPVLNSLLFSPRYVASRVNLLNPVAYAKMPAPVRKMAMKNMIGYIGFGVIVLSLASAAGADVEEDPRSSDFGKIKLGDTRYDIWAGFQQVVRLIAQIVSGQRKSTKTGNITELNKDKFPYETRGDVAKRFARSKLAPTPSTIVNFFEGENIVGEEVTIQGELVKNVIPLYLQDIKGIYDEEGATGVISSAIPAFFGIGVQSYGEKSGLVNERLDPNNQIGSLNKQKKYSISQPSKGDLSRSFDNEIDDETFDKYHELRDAEIKRLFDRYKLRLEITEDTEIYKKYMDQIVREADRKVKYDIAKEKKWDKKPFNEGEKFSLTLYKKDGKGKIVKK